MKNLILIIIFTPFLFYSQKTTDSDKYVFSEMTGKRVFINKEVVSYNFTVVKYQNGTKVSSKDYVDFKNPVPTKISITSDENSSRIQINSKYYKEDIILNFERIYKINYDDGSFWYDFIIGKSCSASYSVPNDNGNQSLSIKCLDNNETGSEITYTMSRNQQL